MFGQLFSDTIALYNWMFRSGDLITAETLARFQKFLSNYGYAICFEGNKIVFEGKVIQPYMSRIKILSHSKAIVYPAMGEAIQVEFKRGKITTKAA